jgi:hypothetical protein
MPPYERSSAICAGFAAKVSKREAAASALQLCRHAAHVASLAAARRLEFLSRSRRNKKPGV